MLHFGEDLEIRRHERLLLRPWLENLIDSGKVPGLHWFDSTRTLFRVPWKHQSRKTWSLGHSSVFLEWAKNTGRWKEGDPEPHYAQLKTRLRCAFSKAPDIEEMKDLHCSKSDEPYKVYRFVPKKESKLYPFGRKAIARKSIHKSLKRSSQMMSSLCHESGNAEFDELMSCRQTMNRYEELPLVRSNELSTDRVEYNLPVMDQTSACLKQMPVHINEFREPLEVLSISHGQMQETGTVIDAPNSCIYQNGQQNVESLNMPITTRLDYKASSTEPMEVQEFCRGQRQTILPRVEGGVNQRPDSKSSCAEQPDSLSVNASPVSVDFSPSANCAEILRSGSVGRSCFDLSDLPKMSVLEKVRSWNLNGSENSAVNGECVQVLSSSSDENNYKVIEKPFEASSENVSKIVPDIDLLLPCKQQNWPSGTVDDTFGDHCAVKLKDKLVLPGKFGDRTGSNIAVATPIFPLKNRYNISKNYQDKERLNFSDENHHNIRNSSDSLDPFKINGNHFQLDQGRDSVDQNGTMKSSRYHLHQNVQDGNLVDQMGVQLGSFPDMSNTQSISMQQFSEASGGFHQNSGRKVDQVLVRLEEQPTKNQQTNEFMEGGMIFQPACIGHFGKEMLSGPSLGRRDERAGRYDSHITVPDEELNQKELFINKLQYGNMRSYTGIHEENWETCETSFNEIQSKLQKSDVYQDHGRVLPVNNANAQDFPQDVFTKEGPLDLSNKADLFFQYGRIDDLGYGSFQNNVHSNRVQMLHSSEEYDKMSDSFNRHGNVQRMEHSGNSDILEVEEFQSKKYGMHGSHGRLKAAYKKLVLRTMFVAEKERELDDLEKRLLLREEAVRQKEESLQKMLLALADARREGEVEKCSNGIRVLPPVDSTQRVDGNCRMTFENGVALSPQTHRAETECFRAEKDTKMETYPSQKPSEIYGDVPLRYVIPRRLDCRDENFVYLPTTTQFDRHWPDVHHSKQHFYEPSPREMSTNQSAFIKHASVNESKDSQLSSVFIPGPVHSRCINSGVASHDSSHIQSNGSRLNEITDGTERQLGVSFERILHRDTSNISLNSSFLRNAKESCDKPFTAGRTEILLFKSAEHERVPWGGKSMGGVAVEGEVITRILPPVSLGVFDIMK